MIRELVSYGSKRLKLRPLHPLVGLEATRATRIAMTAQQTALKNGKIMKVNYIILKQNPQQWGSRSLFLYVCRRGGYMKLTAQ